MIDQRSSAILGNSSAMTVRGFDRRAVKDEDGQQQTKPARERRVPILKCADQHAGQMTNVLESGSFEIVLRGGAKTQFVSPTDHF